ncbi:MAG: hypothetical protein IT472_08955 [Thermomonas sp.]|uniref:LexA family protein n=1 Tax=Thermomonas sp. TaxID=1971895 RepID=UPI00262AEF52|nr:hypothetical protein [Thermomonas sp.]MCC7097294.1 hypothetical protein [Thermomonas sp.]
MTPKQLELLRFIRTFIDGQGYPPTFLEMATALDRKSRGSLHTTCRLLIEQGHLAPTLGSHRQRNLELTAKGRAATDDVPVPDAALRRVGTVVLVDELRRRGCGPSVFGDVPARAS